jgi:CO/xanthine dehydrogenase FAD-binding subunit
MLWQDYHLPTSVDEALALLASYHGEARIVAGGTDLILEIQQGHRPPVKALVDVTRIAGANEINHEKHESCEGRESDYIVIGCGVTHSMLVQSPLIQRHGAALAEGCGVIGGPQVRNVATLAGNIAHALPAGDGTIALLALGGEAQVARCKSQGATSETEAVWLPLERLYISPGKSAIDPTREMISALRFTPTGESEASAFARIMRPQGVALPILGMAARLVVEWHGDATLTVVKDATPTVAKIRISVGPVAPIPFRACNTEAFLLDKPATEATIEAAIPILLNECHPRTSAHRSTAEYRREMLSVLLRQTVTTAIERAKIA